MTYSGLRFMQMLPLSDNKRHSHLTSRNRFPNVQRNLSIEGCGIPMTPYQWLRIPFGVIH